MPDAALRVGVTFEAIRHRRDRSWLVTWRIADRGGGPFTVVEAWHPHGRFRSSRLRRSLRVPARGSASLELPARVNAGPTDVVGNCFLILRVTRGRERWRVLARFALRVDDDGTPCPDVAAVDAHPAGD